MTRIKNTHYKNQCLESREGDIVNPLFVSLEMMRPRSLVFTLITWVAQTFVDRVDVSAHRPPGVNTVLALCAVEASLQLSDLHYAVLVLGEHALPRYPQLPHHIFPLMSVHNIYVFPFHVSLQIFFFKCNKITFFTQFCVRPLWQLPVRQRIGQNFRMNIKIMFLQVFTFL